jgi:hypothetical protein
VGFSKDRPKFSIHLKWSIVELHDLYTMNLKVIFKNSEVEESLDAQYERLQKMCPLLGPNLL